MKAVGCTIYKIRVTKLDPQHRFIRPLARTIGIEEITLWNTRNHRASKNLIPINTDLVICCTDFLNHNAAHQIKDQIKKRNLRAVYCRRTWSELAPEVESCMQKKQLEKQGKPPEKRKKALRRM